VTEPPAVAVTVYGVFRQWQKDGTWKRVHDRLREKVRTAEGKTPTPTAAIIDSQSVKAAEGGEQRGYDAGKKINGRKRHIAVDTLGLLLVVVVHSACIQDYEGGWLVLEHIKKSFRRLKIVFADGAYGKGLVTVHGLKLVERDFDGFGMLRQWTTRMSLLRNSGRLWPI
jgi:putative transposase